MAQKSKQEDFDFMPYWKNEEKCFEEARVEGKDTRTGKKVSGAHWPRDLPMAEVYYMEWLKKVKDPETGEFYKKRDKEGNIIRNSKPRHIIRQIVRIRTSDDKQYLYSNGYLLGYDVLGDPVSQLCQNPETWQRTGFLYKKQYDEKTMSVKARVVGPNSQETVYEMPFNDKNLKQLFDKRVTSEDLRELGQKRMISLSFCVKDDRNGVVREVKDATGIEHKSLELMTKEFDYLVNSNFLSLAQKEEFRRQAIDAGLLPREAGQVKSQGSQEITKPPSGTYT